VGTRSVGSERATAAGVQPIDFASTVGFTTEPSPVGKVIAGIGEARDYFVWNEIPTVIGDLVGGITFVGLTLYTTHARTAPRRIPAASAPAPSEEAESVTGAETAAV